MIYSISFRHYLRWAGPGPCRRRTCSRSCCGASTPPTASSWRRRRCSPRSLPQLLFQQNTKVFHHHASAWHHHSIDIIIVIIMQGSLLVVIYLEWLLEIATMGAEGRASMYKQTINMVMRRRQSWWWLWLLWCNKKMPTNYRIGEKCISLTCLPPTPWKCWQIVATHEL